MCSMCDLTVPGATAGLLAISLLVQHRPSADPPWMKRFYATGDLEKV
jgi:hypothetical protein